MLCYILFCCFVDAFDNLYMPQKEKRKDLNEVCAKDRIKE